MSVTNLPYGPEIMARLDQLAVHSEDSEVLTRTFLTPQHKAAGELLKSWMKEAGMSAGFDAIGNMVGRYEGDRPGLPALLTGSHFDTVRNAGRYDGMLGIVLAISCVKALHQAGERLPFAIEIIGFADEEGVRFGSTLLGSRSVVGNFDPALLEKIDADGISMADALRHYDLDPAAVASAGRTPEQVLAFVELHIEQGPVLLAEGLPLGVVTSIAGATRFQVTMTGLAGHAGTVPMDLRQDAAAAAAEALLCIEKRCQGIDSLVGTVGKLEVPNGATNVIPGQAEFSIDIRAGEDSIREAAVSDIVDTIQAIGQRRRVQVEIVKTHEADASACAPWLMKQMAAAVGAVGVPLRQLPSGAGHDAMAFTDLTDMAMLFVRCGNGGISHHPDESMTVEDADIGTQALLHFIRHFQPKSGYR